MSPPPIVAHADWSTSPAKRWICLAERLPSGLYRVRAPEPAGDPAMLLGRLDSRARSAGVVIGFDFPIGLPAAYATRAGIHDFPVVLPTFGRGTWADFYEVAASADQIGLHRPFYPMRPGGTKQAHLLEGLGVATMADLLRVCERATDKRPAASPLFWTMGAKQVGKAAITGWRSLVAPALQHPVLAVSLWPFDGPFDRLATSGGITIVETYPAEACLHIGLTPPGFGWSKRSQEGRALQSDAILAWAEERSVDLHSDLIGSLNDGFGPSSAAEDPFDAVVGLLGMLEVVLGHREAGAPGTPDVQTVEGWILGLAA